MDEWGGYDDYSAPAYDPNSNAWDPASAYYQPQGWTDQNYVSPGDLPPGGGAYSIGGGDWNTVYAPPSGGGSGGGASGSGMRYGGDSYQSSPSYTPNFNFNHNSGSGSRPMGGGGGGGSGSNWGLRMPGQISLGTPERTLYDRYRSLLMNPNQLESDPAYSFLYNQGLQALNRTLASRRMSLSSNAMNKAAEYGAGNAALGMKQIMPLYQAGAGEELRRFMGPAGLLPSYQQVNNQGAAQANQTQTNAEDRDLYRSMLFAPSATTQDWGSGIGYGGQTSRYTAPQAPAMNPRPLSMGSPDSSMDYSDYDLYNDPWGGP